MLQRPGSRDSEALRIAFEWSSATLVFLDRPLRIETESGIVRYSAGDATSSARTTSFELLRAATGRRSSEEIAAWDWEGEPLADLVVGGPPFTMRSSPLGE